MYVVQITHIKMPSTSEERLKQSFAMKAFWARLKEANPDAFLKKQREDKAKQRKKMKEATVFEMPYVVKFYP